MASIRRTLELHASPASVWSALCAVSEIHTRLARGFVTLTTLEGSDRIVHFANGLTVRERIVAIDSDSRRLAYTVIGGRASHHHASFEVFDGSDGGTRLVWTTDVLPDDVAPALAGMMEQGLVAMRNTLEGTE